MLKVSLHGIAIHAPIGLYPEEKVHGNQFETDVDIWLADERPWPFADYTEVNKAVNDVFSKGGELLETVVYDIHTELKSLFPMAERVRVQVRKLQPPMPGSVGYAAVTYER